MRIAYRANNESFIRDFNALRQALPQPPLVAWVRHLKIPFLMLVTIAFLPVGGYAGTINGLGWISPAIWGAGFLLGLQVWHLVILKWVMRSALRELERYRPERDSEVQLDDVGIRFANEVCQLLLTWESVQAVVHAKHGSGIIADMTTYHVPSSAFQSDEQRLSFEETIRSRMKGTTAGRVPSPA